MSGKRCDLQMRARSRDCSAIALALLVCGCTLGPDYVRPKIDLPVAYPAETHVHVGTGASAAGAASGAHDAHAANGVNDAGDSATVRADWWHLYADSLLDRLIERAMLNNTDLALASARILESEGALREAGASLLPQVNLGAAASDSRVSTAAAVPVPSFAPLIRRDYQLTASTSYELDFWGRLRRSFESSRAQLLATEYARDVVELTLASTVAQTYFMLRSLDAQYAVLQASITSRSESLKITQQRERAGLAGALDVNQAAESLYDATVQARELDRQRAVALHQLQGLTGQLDLQIERENQPGLSLPLPAMPPAGLPSGLLERRPDVAVAEAALKSANAQIGVAQAGQLPTFSLTAVYGGDSLSLSNILSAPARLWSIGGGMTFPVLDWGRYQSRTDQAVARQQQAVATYQKAVQGAFRDVADALSNLQQTQNSEGDLFERTKSARERLRLAQLRYGAGYSPYLEVLDAERTANDADLALVRNRQAVLVYSVDLIRAIGGGWSQSTGFSDRSPDRTPWVQPALLAPQAPPASAPAALG